MLYNSVDPGETTGWARFENGIPLETGELGIDEFFDWLNEQTPELWVMEDYIIRPAQSGGFNHEWGRVPTIQVIGAVKFRAHVTRVPLELQQSGILTPGAAQFGLPHPKSRSLPMRNSISAIIHGKWWWKENGARQCQ